MDTKIIEDAVLKVIEEYNKDLNGEIKVGVSQDIFIFHAKTLIFFLVRVMNLQKRKS